MIKTSLSALTVLMVLALTGCASDNRIVGHNLKEVGHWYGELGITGHLNELTLQSGSRLTKLSIIGDANHVVVEDRATLGKIEVWGENNTISVPEHLVVRTNLVGKGTRIIRRSQGTAPAVGPTAELIPEGSAAPTTPADDLE